MKTPRFVSLVTLLLLLAVVLYPPALFGQIAPPDGIRENSPTVHALTNAKIIVAPGVVIDKGTVVVRDGIIIEVGANVSIPPDARLWDMSGMTIYPGFIDSYSDLGMPKKPEPSFSGEQGPPSKPPEPAHGPRYWNENVHASLNAEDLFSLDQKAAEKLRNEGFTAAVLVPQSGVFRGSSSLINLGDGKVNELLVKAHVAQQIAFETSRGEEYPNSLMGAIALIRQTILDAQWYKEAMQAAAKYSDEPRPEIDSDLASLDALAAGKQLAVFETGDEENILRAAAIAKEFRLNYLVRGSGREFRRLDAIKALGIPVILPVNFPDPPSVQTPEEALNVSLDELEYWDQAPENPGKLSEAGITFALTTSGLKDVSTFLSNIRNSVKRALTENAALAALTTNPAKLWGVEKSMGSIAVGKLANFLAADGNIFDEKTNITETWVRGKRYEVKPKDPLDPRGTWQLHLSAKAPDSLQLILKGELTALQGSLKARKQEVRLSSASFTDMRLALSFVGDSIGMHGVVRMTAIVSARTLLGVGELSDGSQFTWGGERSEKFVAPKDTTKPKPSEVSPYVARYPPGEFGREKLPAQADHVIVRGATIWTCGPQGKIENGDVLYERGKVSKVGKNLTAPPDALVIDGKGKHITPGLIDCHSHTAVSGSVNETGMAITAQVRIADVIDPDDIAIYRELAGGLTVANVLHGSANPIGGQNQVIKLRWGQPAEGMKFAGAMPGIKFALGENPKQSNWGDRYSSRYPQTREGVEQIIRDEFRSALDYEKSWKAYKAGKMRIPPRRDLRSEAVLEILNGERLVHAHSYRQDEIEMLMRIADDFGFKLGTFQHVLEGYKVADLMAQHGVGGSTFSDWWGYKFEVYDAIPYNGALMHNAGVIVSYNSDSDELARRLNTEAAKAVKYGGVSDEEALDFVTINPARQLRIDKRVGSIEPGKDADFVIWSGNPLSTLSVCEQTWIDGRKYFDRQEDRAMSEQIRLERAALIQKVLASAKQGGGESRPPRSMDEKMPYSCHEDNSGKGDR